MPGIGARRPGEAAPLGGRPGAQGGSRLAPLWPHRACELHRLPRLALFLSLSAAARRADRGVLRRAGAAAGSRSSTSSTRTASTSASKSTPAKTSSTAIPSTCFSTRSAATSAATSITTPATSSSNAWTISASSTPITTGSRCSTSRTPSSTRRAKQGVYGGYKAWLERAGRDRSLGDGQVNFKAIFSKLSGYDFAGWAVYEWE